MNTPGGQTIKGQKHVAVHYQLVEMTSNNPSAALPSRAIGVTFGLSFRYRMLSR